MPRTIDSTITDELSASAFTPFHLLDFTVGSITYRYTDFQIGLYVTTIATSGMFEPYSWDFGGSHHSVSNIVDNVDITVLNLDQAFTSLFIEDVVQGSECNIWGGVLNTAGDIIGVYRIFTGTIDEWSLDEEELNFTVVSELYQWSQSTSKKHSSSCRWREFKGLECKFVGVDTWCDRSYNRCESLDNADNFGGFRWLPTLEDTEVWWGRRRLDRG